MLSFHTYLLSLLCDRIGGCSVAGITDVLKRRHKSSVVRMVGVVVLPAGWFLVLTSEGLCH